MALVDCRMPPTRGHDLKLSDRLQHDGFPVMPPTRGHDLKHGDGLGVRLGHAMPPTRGHDLKQYVEDQEEVEEAAPDAPHTGARLET